MVEHVSTLSFQTTVNKIKIKTLDMIVEMYPEIGMEERSLVVKVSILMDLEAETTVMVHAAGVVECVEIAQIDMIMVVHLIGGMRIVGLALVGETVRHLVGISIEMIRGIGKAIEGTMTGGMMMVEDGMAGEQRPREIRA